MYNVLWVHLSKKYALNRFSYLKNEGMKPVCITVGKCTAYHLMEPFYNCSSNIIIDKIVQFKLNNFFPKFNFGNEIEGERSKFVEHSKQREEKYQIN